MATTAPGLKSWSEKDFVRAMREGVRPDGEKIDAASMPIAYTKKLHDVELQSLFDYLKSIPAAEMGT